MLKSSSEKKILNIIKYTPPIFIIITSFFIILFSSCEHQNILREEVEQIKKDFLAMKKNEVKNKVEMVEKFIENSIKANPTLSTNILQKNIINELKKFEYKKDRYIFLLDYSNKIIGNNKVLIHANKNFLDKKFFDVIKTEKARKEVIEIISLAKKGSGFITYTQFQKPNTKEFIEKTSYILGLNKWKWLIGAGFYHDELTNAVKQKKEDLEKHYKEQLFQTFTITFSSATILLILSFYYSITLKHRFNTYKNEIEKNIQEKEEYTKLLNQQSKMASIGEMLGNIAHQWRQPLTIISMSANNMKMDIDLDEVNLDTFQDNIADINSQTEYLSNTIDDFRNFFKQSNELTIFNINDVIQKTLNLLKVQFSYHDIKIIANTQDGMIKGTYNEFIQVLINILNNSKDAFDAKKDKGKKYIFIDLCVEDEIILTIKDNAGGIDESVLGKIYEPYITTKHKTKGTGIGLYMSKEIITKHMKGQIDSINIEYEYEEEQYIGILTTIKLPLVESNHPKE